MLAEPPTTPYDLRFSIAGIPVRVHPLFWLVALFLGLGPREDPKLAIIWVGVVFVSVLIHELGHALTARSFGYHPRITLHGFGGLASYEPTRYDPARQITITIAGPLAGFLFAAVIVGVLMLLGYELHFFGRRLTRGEPIPNLYAYVLVHDLLLVNIFWGVINLFPVLPLDGGQIARDILLRFHPRQAIPTAYQLSMITAAALAIFSFVRLGSFFMSLFFGYLAYASFVTWQSYQRSSFRGR